VDALLGHEDGAAARAVALVGAAQRPHPGLREGREGETIRERLERERDEKRREREGRERLG
jgi:ribonuclease E